MQQKATTITRRGSTITVVTSYPTNSNGQPITDGSETFTIISYAAPGTVTLLEAVPGTGTSNYQSSITPIDPLKPITIINYITRSRTTITQAAETPQESTIIPPGTDVNVPITIIHVIRRSTVTLSTPVTGEIDYTSTITPTNINSPITLIMFLHRTSTTTFVETGSSDYTTTIYPTETAFNIPVTIIHYIHRTTITISSPATGASDYTSIITPTNINSPITLIRFVHRTSTVTLTEVNDSDYTTTIYPTDSAFSVPVTVIRYITQPVVTLTTRGPFAGTSTRFPTDSAGSTINDESGTVSVIVTVLPEVLPTVTVVTTGPIAGTSTEYPIDGAGSTITAGTSGTVTVLITEPVVIITRPGLVSGTTTQLPTDSAGSTLTDGSGTVTIIITSVVQRPTVTETSVASTTGLTTIFPSDTSDPFATVSVITFQPLSTITYTRVDTSTHITTEYPSDTAEPGGIVTVITYAVLPSITVTRVDTSTHITTAYPPDTTGPGGTITIITYVVLQTVSTTQVGLSTHVTTEYPPNTTDPGGVVTVISYVVLSTTTITAASNTTYITTEYPTDTADISGIVTIITYVSQPTVSFTLVGSNDFTTTIFPTNSTGGTIVPPTATVTVLAYKSPPVPGPSPGPAFDCGRYAYVVIGTNLYKDEIDSGQITLIKSNFVGGTTEISGIGFNSMDNYLYGLNYDTNAILRIASNGSITKVGQVNNSLKWNAVDIDANGQCWQKSGSTWLHIDLNPYSPTYAQTIASGTVVGTDYGVADWSSIPGFNNTLWAMIVNSGSLALVRFDIITSEFTLVFQSTVATSGFGSSWADERGNIYGYQNGSGKIYVMNVYNPANPVLHSTGTVIAGGTDGAHCVWNNFVYPVVTVTLTQTARSTHITTVYPPQTGDMTITATVITYYVPQNTTTITLGGTTTTEATLYPTNSNGSTITAPTATVTVVTYEVPPILTATAGPMFNCSSNGYIQRNTSLYEIDIDTLAITTLNDDIGVGFNAFGYNILDNYIYGASGSNISRFNALGDFNVVVTNANTTGVSIGDIDDQGHYWIAATAANTGVYNWTQIDLNPFSTSYGATLASGTTTVATDVLMADWVYIPSIPGSLWSIGQSTTQNYPILLRFDTTPRKLNVVMRFTTVTGSGDIGGIIAKNNGDIYAISNNGNIYKSNVITKAIPVLVDTLPTAARGDATRCIYADLQADVEAGH
ncbi:Zonadhesin [Arthrobotrys entomopaga]|nr:Zonadhesin [Arthrobotrys entomopaga]